ncbi:MAG: Hydrolase SCO5215, alpha/beta fold family [uncultured Propionibacteriaceae bacterium]|uniref:Hydrolase SCO5215, alpha/beta fold family n=1 Tax=uncultured Propionibacteriaceae bacterium TaxID=257457 RepID=A0A6J4PGC3_9ACTN|nr:MAG: Hydrolase SCO5215, alpha/beta fold family [uncultured Propionibacteriaceae bacterium]
MPVDTAVGPGRLYVNDTASAARAATLLLGHGAGGGVDAPDLSLLAGRLPSLGVRVLRFEQPWRTAGKKVAVAAPRLDQAWRAAVDTVLGWGQADGRLFFGGRSAGARVACRTAPEYDVAGVVCLAFPLHPPGRPDRSRAAELLTPAVPRLVLQGSSDAFGGPDEVREATAQSLSRNGGQIRIVELPGADHGFRLAKSAPLTPADLRELVVAEVSAFIGVDQQQP